MTTVSSSSDAHALLALRLNPRQASANAKPAGVTFSVPHINGGSVTTSLDNTGHVTTHADKGDGKDTVSSAAAALFG